MDYIEPVVAVALLEVTLSLLLILWLVRRIRRLEETLSRPAPGEAENGVQHALTELTAEVSELSVLKERVSELAVLSERIAGLEGLEKRLPDTSGLEAQLSTLVERSEMLERLETMEKALHETLDREPPSIDLKAQIRPMLTEVVESLDARLRNFTASLHKDQEESMGERVRRVLGERGFSEVTVVSSADTEGGRSRVVVEAKRDGMSFKGPVLIEKGRVVEQKLRPSYPMFP